jgi:hypothetical protein
MSNNFFRTLFGERNQPYYFYNPAAPFNSMLIAAFYWLGMWVTIQSGIALYFGDPLTELLIVRKPYFFIPFLLATGVAVWLLERIQYRYIKRIRDEAGAISSELQKTVTNAEGNHA